MDSQQSESPRLPSSEGRGEKAEPQDEENINHRLHLPPCVSCSSAQARFFTPFLQRTYAALLLHTKASHRARTRTRYVGKVKISAFWLISHCQNVQRLASRLQLPSKGIQNYSSSQICFGSASSRKSKRENKENLGRSKHMLVKKVCVCSARVLCTCA